MRRLLVLFASVSAVAAFGQAPAVLTCGGNAIAPLVRSEGIAERLGDITLTCAGGQPGGSVTGNLTLFLSVNVTNRQLSDGTLDVLMTVDNAASGQPSNPVPANVKPVLAFANNSVAWNGLSFTLSPSGTATLRIANLRGNASQSSSGWITAEVSSNMAPLTQFVAGFLSVGVPQTGLYTNFSSQLICAQAGATFPGDLTFASLLAASSYFASARITEGFADAFSSRQDPAGLNADTGTRILVRYSGFPSNARLVVPDYIAGYNADIPTAGGDLGLAPSGGRYTPGRNQLLLIRVRDADPTGAGGTLAGPEPAATTDFNAVSLLSVPATGTTYAVYEVVSNNPAARDIAQFPTWLAVEPSGSGISYETVQEVMLAPVSAVRTVSTTAPVPRFTGVAPGNDCFLLGDCTAPYFPALSVNTTPLQVTTPSNQNQARYVTVRNAGGGALYWSAAVQYLEGSNWLRLYPPSGVNAGTIQAFVAPSNLAPGTYRANIVVDAGPVVGSRTIPFSVTVTAPQPEVRTPSIRAVSSAADASASLAPGSLGTVYGSNLNGTATSLSVAGAAAEILYRSPAQINFRVPSGVAAGGSMPLVVTVDGVSSLPFPVTVTAVAPAIFGGAVLNQDNSANGPAVPAAAGSIVQIFATGLDPDGRITAKIHDQDVANPVYAGAAPGLPGVQQINLRVPAGMATMQTYVYVCGAPSSGGAQTVCSPAHRIWVQGQ